MNLCIDIGNTRVKAAVFDEAQQLVHSEVWPAADFSKIKLLAANHPVRNVILSSVAIIPPGVEDYFQRKYRYLRLSADLPLPLAIAYRTPATLGLDRIAAAAGACSLFPGSNCLIIDAGTCITADILDAQGRFLGGNISPGLEMRWRAMHEFTARLPLLSRDWAGVEALPEPQFIGSSTSHAIWNGGVLGIVWELQGFIRQSRKQFKSLRVILTGGDADFFAKKLKTSLFLHPHLVLTGLNKILSYNVKKTEVG